MIATTMQRGRLALAPPGSWRDWRYGGGKRDLRIDLLRGFAAFAMIVDHIGGGGSWLYAVTGGNHFFISAAEAFVFISGVMMGMVYAGVIARQGAGAALAKSLRRGGTLYTLAVALTLAYPALSLLMGMPWAPHMTASDLPAFVTGVLTLHRTYYLVDIPLLYTFLVWAGGPLLVLMARGQTRAVLAGSWGLWALWQCFPAQAQVPWAIQDNGTFHLAAWQVWFVTGMAIGYHRRTVETRLRRLPAGMALAVSGALVLLLVAWCLHLGHGEVAHRLFGKPDVRMGRLVAFPIVATFVFTLVTVAWQPVQRAAGWLLLPLGQHALWAYSVHIFVVAALVRWHGALTEAGLRGGAGHALIQLAGVMVVWGTIKARPALSAQVRGLRTGQRVTGHVAVA